MAPNLIILLTIPHYFWLTELGNIIESLFTLQAYFFFFKFLSAFQLWSVQHLTVRIGWGRRLEQLFTVLPLVSFFPPDSFLPFLHALRKLPKSVFSWNDYFLLLTCLNTNYSKCVTFDFSSHNFSNPGWYLVWWSTNRVSVTDRCRNAWCSANKTTSL